MKNAALLMIVGDYVEDYEVMVPFQALQMVGHKVDAVCPTRKLAKRFVPPFTTLRATRLIPRSAGTIYRWNASFDTIDAADYDGLVLPGGRAQNICG